MILADGKAAGFNTAMLAEIGKKLHRNIELVNVDSAARATALTSKNVDVMFWAILPADDDRPGDMDKPEGIDQGYRAVYDKHYSYHGGKQ